VAQKALELLGYTAELATNGKEAVDLTKSELFDLILMDIQMPEMDGIEATKRIRKSLSTNDQPVIMAMTAASQKGEKDIYIESGMDDFIPKPIDVDELADKIVHWFPEN